jgi:hypothetical protein
LRKKKDDEYRIEEKMWEIEQRRRQLERKVEKPVFVQQILLEQMITYCEGENII